MGPSGSSAALKSGPSSPPTPTHRSGLLNFERATGRCLGTGVEEGVGVRARVDVKWRVGSRVGGGVTAQTKRVNTGSLFNKSRNKRGASFGILSGGCFTSPRQQDRIPQFALIRPPLF